MGVKCVHQLCRATVLGVGMRTIGSLFPVGDVQLVGFSEYNPLPYFVTPRCFDVGIGADRVPGQARSLSP